MGTGAVLYSTGKSKLTDLGGLGKHQKLLCGLYLVAAFSISGFPLFNGFISKSMTVAAAGESHQYIAMFGMILAAVGTFLSVGLKLPYFTWFSKEKPKDLEVKPLPKNMYVGMAIVAFFCIFHGIFPQHLYNWLPNPVGEWTPFNLPHFVETVQLLIFTFAAFWAFRFTLLKPKPYIALDVDWFYRKPAKYGRIIFVNPVDNFFNAVEKLTRVIAGKLVVLAKNPFIVFSSKTPETEPYTPDRYRPLSQALILAALGLFVLVVCIGIMV